MDLHRCPKCGDAWAGGDKCRKCGFVPIGAGLDKLPKKKKRKVKYREPGSWTSLLSFVFLLALGGGAVAYQPWRDDWELIRSLMGQGRRHAITGEWEVTKSLRVGEKKGALLVNRRVQKGLFTFSKAGQLNVKLFKGSASSVGSGKYTVDGQLVKVDQMRTSVAAVGGLPAKFNLFLAWTGPDSLVATTAGEAIYLRRKPPKGALAKLVPLAVDPNKMKAPGEMRGVIANMEGALKEIDN